MRTQIQTGMVALALAACGPLGQAAEHVTLSNGFRMDCDHHALVDGQMRLYLNAGESSYIVLRPEEVTGVELAPDLPSATVSGGQNTANVALSTADLHQMLAEAGQAHNLDVDLLASVVKAESDGNAHALSRSGAQGLMQLMPSTADELGVKDSFEPEQNVRGGSAYLDALLRKYHENLALALAAYNAGQAAVDKYHGVPPYHETRVYVAHVIHEFNRRVQAREALVRHAAGSSVTSRASGSQ